MSTSSSADRSGRIAALNYAYADKPKVDQPRCNLCGSERFTVITQRDRYGFPAATVACMDCGLARMNPRMTSGAYAEFYQHVYRPLVSAYHGRTIDATSVQEEQWVYAEEMGDFYEPFLTPRNGQSFLDVGGSTGVVSLAFAKRFGLRPTVLDPAPDEIREADRYGIETVTALLEEWDSGDAQYDVVGMFQTIDHLLDVSASFEILRKVIKPDGLFLVDIVDFRHAYLKNGSVEQATKIDHPFSLTEDSAEAYLARAGFETLRKCYSKDHHLVCYACRPRAPQPDAMPAPESVRAFFREIRAVQSHGPQNVGARP